jgi:hypothetical protein
MCTNVFSPAVPELGAGRLMQESMRSNRVHDSSSNRVHDSSQNGREELLKATCSFTPL